jgi:hypothetical protein
VQNRAGTALAFGFLVTVAIALVALSPLFALLAFIGLGYLGFQLAERMRPPKSTPGQFVFLYVFWALIFLLPFAAVGAFVYTFAQAGRAYGEWTVLGVVFLLATAVGFLLPPLLNARYRDPDAP